MKKRKRILACLLLLCSLAALFSACSLEPEYEIIAVSPEKQEEKTISSALAGVLEEEASTAMEEQVDDVVPFALESAEDPMDDKALPDPEEEEAEAADLTPEPTEKPTPTPKATEDAAPTPKPTEAPTQEPASTEKPMPEAEEEPSDSQSRSSGASYILNKNTGVFHYPDCSSVDRMNESNKIYFDGDRQEAIEKGYKPCQRCNP